MDHDAIDDIIVMDSIGSLYIFYGKQNGVFVVQFVENVYDFVLGSNPKTSYFVGAVRYDGAGYKDPRNIKKSTDPALLSKQSIIEQTLFTDVKLPKTTTTTPTVSAGTNVYNTLNTDSN